MAQYGFPRTIISEYANGPIEQSPACETRPAAYPMAAISVSL